MTTSHEEENSVFEKIVTDKKDAVAMIAYCYYKLEKLKYFKDNLHLDDAQKHATCHALIAKDNLDRIKQDAVDAIRAGTSKAIDDYKKSIKPLRIRCWGVIEGAIAGLIVTLIAPFIWIGLFHLLKGSNLWQPFVEWVNEISKN